MEKKGYLRQLSSVDEVLQLPAVQVLAEAYPRSVVVEAVRTIIDEIRQTILSATDRAELEGLSLEPEHLIPLVSELVEVNVSPA